MWDEHKQNLFDTLRLKEAQGTLSNAEKNELSAMFAELEAEEANTLKEGMEKLDSSIDFLSTEKERIKNKNESLAAIVNEQEQLLQNAREYLAHLKEKQAVLRAKYRQATGQQIATLS